MTVKDIHTLLCSRNYYDIDGSKMYRFNGNSMYIDRKAGVAFAIHEEDGAFYLGTIDGTLQNEEVLRIETNHPDGNTFHFYSKQGQEILVLE